MRLSLAFVAAIPATIHFHRAGIQIGDAIVTIELKVPALVELRQRQFALMMAQMTIEAQQNNVVDFIAAALALRLDVMILETAMIILLRNGRASANATLQTVAQVDLKTYTIG